MKIPASERRSQLLACALAVAPLATNRQISAVHVSKIEADHEIRRVLETIVRRWTKGVEPSFVSAAGRDAASADLDHVVPCRVIVDRMIMDPSSCEALLQQSIVLARIAKEEHRRLGGIYQDHRDLYARMLTCGLDELAALGMNRYEAKGIRLEKVVHR